MNAARRPNTGISPRILRPARAAVTLASAMILAALTAAGTGGCKGVTLIPNSDPALRKSRAEFAEDAELRHPFKSDAPSGGEARGRAMIDYGTHVIQVENLSDQDWNNVEVWINRKYVVFVPRIPGNAPTASKPKAETLDFQMFFDEKGQSFPIHNQTDEGRIRQLELLRDDGKIYTLKSELAD